MPSRAGGSVIRTGTIVFISALMLASPGAPQPAGVAPTVTRVVSMEYPMLARMAKLQGTVRLTAFVMPDGTVGSVTVLSGPEPLATPARDNILKWHLDGCPAAGNGCAIEFTFSFVLSGICTDSPRCPTEFQVDLPNRVLVKSQVFGKLLP